MWIIEIGSADPVTCCNIVGPLERLRDGERDPARVFGEADMNSAALVDFVFRLVTEHTAKKELQANPLGKYRELAKVLWDRVERNNGEKVLWGRSKLMLVGEGRAGKTKLVFSNINSIQAMTL